MRKFIPGYENLYEATSDGEIWSCVSNKFLTPGLGSTGYRFVALCKNGKRKQFLVSRLIASTFLSLHLSDLSHQVDHGNLGIKCDSVSNLTVRSQLEHRHQHTGRLGIDTETHKLCAKCGRVKLKCEFHKRHGSSDGLKSYCKSCRNKRE